MQADNDIFFKIEHIHYRLCDEFVEEHEPVATGVDFIEGGLCVGYADAPFRERWECLSEFGQSKPAVARRVQLCEQFPLLELLAQLAQEHSEFGELYLVSSDLAEAMRSVFGRIERSGYCRLRVEHCVVDREHVPDALLDFGERKVPVSIGVELAEHSLAAFLVLRGSVQRQLGINFSPIHRFLWNL